MSSRNKTPRVRCAIYTRKSTEEGLDQEFNTLDVQREAGESYVASQKAEGWTCLPDRYDDGGFTGANIDRPALQRLLADIEARKVDCVVVYKVDRLSRSLMGFARLMEVFDRHEVAFVAVTQQFATGTSMGRLTLNVLLSFAQFEREMISERTRDKIAASRRKGKWGGGHPVLGYDVEDTKLIVNEAEAERVRAILGIYIDKQSLIETVRELDGRGWRTKQWTSKAGMAMGGKPYNKNNLRGMLTNPLYVGKVRHRDETFDGEHERIIDDATWQRVQQSLASNGRRGGTHVRNKHGALLKGILFCGPCGAAMSHIRLRINALGERFNIKESAIDRWNATQLALQLQNDGFNVVTLGQGFKDMTAPSKELEKLVISGKLRHGGHPVLRWMASNVAAETDAAGNLKPSKKKSTERIDGIVATVMALGRAMLDEKPGSVYDTRGLFVV